MIYVHEGKELIAPFLEYNFAISFISEVELLGFNGLNKTEEVKLKSLIADCFCIDWNSKIKEQTIELRKNYAIKLPDAIIAATSLVFDIPLISADKGYSKIKNLDLILIEI